MKLLPARRVAHCLGVSMLLARASHKLFAQTRTSPATGCQFSSQPKSSLSWESGLAQGQGPSTSVARDAVVGRVIAVRNGEPVTDAVIRLDPGDHLAHVDSGGRFAFRPLPQGRYRVSVMSWTRGSAVDSVTLGFDGLRIVASLAAPTGDIGCTLPMRQPSNER